MRFVCQKCNCKYCNFRSVQRSQFCMIFCTETRAIQKFKKCYELNKCDEIFERNFKNLPARRLEDSGPPPFPQDPLQLSTTLEQSWLRHWTKSYFVKAKCLMPGTELRQHHNYKAYHYSRAREKSRTNDCSACLTQYVEAAKHIAH